MPRSGCARRVSATSRASWRATVAHHPAQDSIHTAALPNRPLTSQGRAFGAPPARLRVALARRPRRAVTPAPTTACIQSEVNTAKHAASPARRPGEVRSIRHPDRLDHVTAGPARVNSAYGVAARSSSARPLTRTTPASGRAAIRMKRQPSQCQSRHARQPNSKIVSAQADDRAYCVNRARVITPRASRPANPSCHGLSLYVCYLASFR
jgi:hypothetical protein